VLAVLKLTWCTTYSCTVLYRSHSYQFTTTSHPTLPRTVLYHHPFSSYCTVRPLPPLVLYCTTPTSLYSHVQPFPPLCTVLYIHILLPGRDVGYSTRDLLLLLAAGLSGAFPALQVVSLCTQLLLKCHTMTVATERTCFSFQVPSLSLSYGVKQQRWQSRPSDPARG